MAIRHTPYAPQTGPQMSFLDDSISDLGLLGVIPCTTQGTNLVTLTPQGNAPTVNSYTNLQRFQFTALNTSTGNVTLQVGSLSALPVYAAGSTNSQIGANGFIALVPYDIIFVQAVNSGNGGFIVLNANNAAPVLRSYLAGYTISNNSGAPNTRLDVAPGTATDDTNVATLTSLGGTINTSTSGVGGLDTGALAANTTYHAYAISQPGGAAVALMMSSGASNPVFPALYTLKRRLGSVMTNSSAQIIVFQQNGDYFRWSTPPLDGNSVALTTAYANLTISVPLGVAVEASGNLAVLAGGGANVAVQVRPPFASDGTPSGTLSPLATAWVGITTAATVIDKWFSRTNTSSQIQWAASGNINASLTTEGWIDYRGRFN